MSAPRRLTEPQVLAVARGLLSELAALHDGGGVSGVVGPSTVLIGEDGAVRLVAGPVDQAYASPEVLDGQQPTPRSDLYSAGAVLAHLFRGEPTLPPTVADLDPGIGWLLGPVLAVDPAARPGSAAAMVTAVDQLAEQRHGPEWWAAAGLVGAVGVTGAVPVVVLATGGTAAAAGAAGVASAAGAASAAGGTAALAGGGGAAGSATSVAGTGAAGQVAAGGGVVAPHGAALGAAAPGAGAPAAAGGAGGASAGTGQGVISTGGAQASGHTAHAAGISKGVAVKVGAVAAGGTVAVAGVAAAVILMRGGETGGGETKNVELPATADIYLVGASDEIEAQLSDPGTRPVSIDVAGAGKVTFPSVEGDVSACSGCEPETPDGGNMSFGSTGITAFNGIAGVSFADRTLFVVGVFVGDDQPTQPDDAVVDLSDADDKPTQEPALGEPFFVGDGETADGDAQEVVVPDDATTLYLGFADAYGFYGTPGAYGDNSGTVDIEVAID